MSDQQQGEAARELTRLAEGRALLHWAAQLASAAGATLLPTRADYSHTNLTWSPGLRALVCRPLTRHSGLQVALELESLALLLIGHAGGIVERRALVGMSLEEGIAWVRAALDRATPPWVSVPALKRPTHEMPDAPQARGAAFTPVDEEVAARVTSLYDTSHRVLTEISRSAPEASPVRCWPHHFDIATLLSLPRRPGENAETARAIGLGMSPGDGGIAAPYWYVTPWPYPSRDAPLPPLARGAWHREGWTGAVLRLDELRDKDGDTLAAELRAFLQGALAACRTILAEHS